MPTAELITSQRLTRRNPDGMTYRVPLLHGVRVTISGDDHALAVLGDISDKLGMYEDTGFSIKELRELKEKREKGLI